MIAVAEGGSGWLRGWNTCGTNVAGLWEARIAGTAAQTRRKDKAASLDGGTGEAGRSGHDRRFLQEAQQHMLRNTVFVSDARECGDCDRSAETEERGGHRRSSGGRGSQQCVWQHVETVRVGSWADSLPTDAGNVVHAVGKRKYHSMHGVERGTWQGALAAKPTFASHFT